MKIIIGLGNPGKDYESTRHNVGFDFVDRLAKTHNAESFTLNKKFEAEITEIVINDTKVLLAKPQTFMNNSGIAVQKIMNFYKISFNDLIVVYDEMDFEPGKFAFSISRGSAGHNGIESIAQTLGTTDFARLRIGIGRTQHAGDKANYVLNKPSAEDQKNIQTSFGTATKAIETWVADGLTKAMNAWNGV